MQIGMQQRSAETADGFAHACTTPGQIRSALAHGLCEVMDWRARPVTLRLRLLKIGARVRIRGPDPCGTTLTPDRRP